MLLAVAMVCAPHARAQSVEEQATALTRQLMSPFCPGLLLADCQSEGAVDLRDEIRRRLLAGEPVKAIEGDIVTRFGPAVLGLPPLEGFGLVAWIGPLALGLAALGVVVLALRKATPRADPSRQDGDARGPDDLVMENRLQDELDQLG
jgi:cytochrome c-type biogenesis protein CcmH